jgi:transposase
MYRISDVSRQRIVNMKTKGMSFSTIRSKLIEEDDVVYSRQAISNFWHHYNSTGSIKPKHGGGKKRILSEVHLEYIDKKMKENNELNGKELQQLLESEFQVQISVSTILKWRRNLGWKYGQTRYCQMITPQNREKRVIFARSCMENDESFDDVIFTDETKIQMSSNVHRQCYKKGEPLTARLRPKPKHPYQVIIYFHQHLVPLKQYQLHLFLYNVNIQR